MNKVYLSGPITGLCYEDARYGWRQVFTSMLAADIGVLSPMRHEGHLAEMKSQMSVDALKAFEAERNHMFSHPKMIVGKDVLDIERSEIMVVNLQGAKAVSQGTIFEIGYAYAKGKTIVVITDPTGNPHTTPFITEAAKVVVYSLEEAAMIVNSLMSEGL